MEREVDDRVVAMEAVVASSKDGGVQGRRSGRPGEEQVQAIGVPSPSHLLSLRSCPSSCSCLSDSPS